MNTVKLEKYLNYEFSSGSYVGQDYKTFQTKYINVLKEMCEGNDWELVKANKNHYQFSAFVKDTKGNFVYLSIQDVRFSPNEWYYHILIRTAKHDRDYSGGRNNFAKLPHLSIEIKRLFDFQKVVL